MEIEALQLNTGPTTYPVTLEEAKIHLRLWDLDEEDALITSLIIAATEQAEAFTQRRFITQTWTLYLDNFHCNEIQIPYPPLVSVTSVKYYNTEGTLTTLVANTDYVVDSIRNPARVMPAPNIVWPSVQSDKPNAVEIKFVCGYGVASAVPASIKAAILILIGHFYEHRQEIIIGTIVADVPKASEWLLWPYRDLRNI